MSEEDSPVPYEETVKPTKKERKEKLPTKKAWTEMVNKWLSLNNPEGDPEELLRLTKATQQYNNPNKTPEEREKAKVVQAIREERLRRQGLNPTDWAYHHSTQPSNFGSEYSGKSMEAPFTEEDMKQVSSRLPNGIEPFVIQGGISSESEYVKEENPFKEIDHTWEIYVRVKPQQIEDSSPQIVSPPPQIEGPNPTT